MDQELLKRRTKGFAIKILQLCRELPSSVEGHLVGKQLFRSATSVGAKYRAACRVRSKADFITKLAIVLEEADEALYWLEILDEGQIVQSDLIAPLIQEANELVAIFVVSLSTSKRKS